MTTIDGPAGRHEWALGLLLLQHRHSLQQTMQRRWRHRHAARYAQAQYNENPRIATKLALLIAQERCRGSKARAREVHAQYRAFLRAWRAMELAPASGGV